jgi:hypothetical protein
VIEVFVSFTKGTELARLERTLEAWDLPGLEPIAIQCGLRKFEIHRRVTAENVSRGTYVLADLDFGPVEEEFAEIAEGVIASQADAGLIECGEFVVVCRKGVITRWPAQVSPAYRPEHQEAYQLVGYKAISCPTLHCRQLAVSSPLSSVTAKPH